MAQATPRPDDLPAVARPAHDIAAPGARHADLLYLVETPENVAIEYELAGIGSRFLAAIVDTLLIALAQLLLLWAAYGQIAEALQPAASLIVAVGAALGFAILWGYYIAFELIWSGQSPGKRLLGLRVLREGGRPISFLSSAIRNVVRVIDFLPFFYGFGVVAMFADSRARRLGDLAAGTIVVRESAAVTLATLLPQPAPALPPEAAAGLLPNIAALDDRDYALVQEFLSRRRELGGAVRRQLAAQLAAGVRARLGLGPEGDAEQLLLFVAEQYRAYRREVREPD